MEYKLNVMDFGAVGDGITDDSQAFQNTINEAKVKGIKLIYVPPRRFFFKNEVKIDFQGLKIYGEGGLSYQKSPSWYITGDSDCLFKVLDGQTDDFSVTFKGLNFYSTTGYTNQVAIEVNSKIHVKRPFNVEECSFRGFFSGIRFKSDDINNQYTWAFVNIVNNIFVGNQFSLRADTGIIGLRYERNESEAGGRIYGNIWGNVWIVNNNFEGQKEPIYIETIGTTYVYLAHNYYEANYSTTAANTFKLGGGKSHVKVEPNFNMFESTNFISVDGAKLVYTGEGDISQTFVFPDFQNGLRFVGKVLAGNAFTIPLRNIAYNDFPFWGVIMETDDLRLGRIDESSFNTITYNTTKPTAYSDTDVRFKTGELVCVSIPYRYTQAGDEESLLVVLKDATGNNRIGGGYLGDVNSNSDTKFLFYCFIAPSNINGLKVELFPFASQNDSYPNATLHFGQPFIYSREADKVGIVRYEVR